MFYSKNLKKIKQIKHCFFSRKGGFSKGIYKGLNCGKGSKDNKANVKRNLKFVSKKINVKLDNLKLMYQTHSNRVIVLNKNNKKLKNFYSDAIITSIKGYALGANFTFTGRSFMYGLGAMGDAGAELVLELLMKEVDTTLAQIGCKDITQLNDSYIW